MFILQGEDRKEKFLSLPGWQCFNLLQNFNRFHVLTVMVSLIEDKDQRQPRRLDQLEYREAARLYRSCDSSQVPVSRLPGNLPF